MKTSKLHIRTTIALLVIPVLMIWFNGYKALDALLWNSPAQTTVPIVQGEDEEEYKLDFGIYDPNSSWRDSTISWDYEQLYIHWLNFDRRLTEQKISSILAQGSKLILIIEPWAKYKTPLFNDIVTGKYDAEISRIKNMLQSFQDTLYVSWGHEMDQDLTKRYDWSSKDSSGYKAAYKHVHSRLNTPNVKWIWAPVGKKNCNNFWPGDNYVDVIGLPIYSFPDFDYEYYGRIRSFKEAFGEKYELVQEHNKPVFLLEFGVSGSEDYEAYWVREAFENFNKFDLLKLVVFFNSRDTEGAWGEKYKTPDWSVNQEVVSAYIKTYRQ